MCMLVFFCAALQMVALTQAEAQYFIIAPNVVRVDVEETILVDIFGTVDGDVPVTLYFQLTGSNERISEKTIWVSKGAPQEVTLQIRRDQLPQEDTSKQQFITLFATANTARLQINDRRTILLSYQSGFVFIQTDKPLYTPSQKVNIRVVALNQKMRPAYHQLKVDILNPDQIIVYRYEEIPNGGFLNLEFTFPPLPVFGNWTVRAHYGHQFKANTSVQFEVKEYVLPKFSVEVSTQNKYIIPETRKLTTYVKARYTFGEPVVGNYLVKYGVYTDDGNLTILQRKQGRLGEEGRAYPVLVMADVTLQNWAEALIGKRLIIQAIVTEKASGETVSVNNTMVIFSQTPYKFNWDRTQKYFKKGLPFAVKASVQYMSGLPAAGITVSVSATAELDDGDQVLLGASNAGQSLHKVSSTQGEVDFRLEVPADTKLITIRAETNDPNLSTQSQGSFTVLPQESSNGEFLLVRLPSSGGNSQTQQIGWTSNIDVLLTHPENVETLHYFVIAGGKIVHKGTKDENINANMGLGLRITQDMAPSSRVVAYYASTSGDIIADGLFFEVKETCENPIHLEFGGLPKVPKDDEQIFKTDGSDKNVELQISANEYTNVGLLAVDEAVFTLRNYHRLTQKKVFKRMAGYDLGCGPGGGQTTAKIFKDAGVTVMTNTDLEVPQREALGCPVDAKRTRRSITETDLDKILNKHQDPDDRHYCEKGLRQLKNPNSMTCAQRTKRFAKRNGLALTSREIRVFLGCCEELDRVARGRFTGPGPGGSSQVDLENVVVRTNFPESWMFEQVDTEENLMVRHPVTLPDSVTTWVIEAVGVSEDYQMCVADPIKLEVRPPFFLDINMPYAVQRLEQIEILVSVFNYADVVLQVDVYLKGVEGLCSEARAGGYSNRISIEARPKKPASVKFVVVPLEAGAVPIEVVAITNSTTVNYRDAVRKSLNVRSEGYKQRDTVTIMVDPENSRSSPRRTLAGGRNQSFQHTQFWGGASESKQVDIIRYQLSNQAIPNTHQVHFSLMGNTMGSVIETVLGGLDNLLRIPRGCGEQTMLNLAPNVYIYRYLKHTDQFTATHEIAAQQYIGDGIANQLAHRRSNGSFSVWGSNSAYPSSTWLTAFVSKVMCQAREFAFVDDAITCQAMEWLITQTQRDEGYFREIYRVHHLEMTGGVQGDVSLTAYVLISLLECNCQTVAKNASVANATSFLEGQLIALTRPYAIAITSYALALAGSGKAGRAIQKLKGIAIYDEATNTRHWGSDDSSFGAGPKPYWYSNRPKAIEVETTSYAVLALLQRNEIQYTHAIINWLTNQENYEGGFVSTQDTVIALQALSEYAIQTDQSTVDINCHVTCQESNFEESYLLKPHNSMIRQHSQLNLPESVSEFVVTFDSQGNGMGQMKFESSYHVPEPDHRKCDFELVINGQEGKSGDSGPGGGGDNNPEDGDSRSRVGRIHARSAMERGSGAEENEGAVGATVVAPRGRAGGSGNEYIFQYNIKVRYLRGEETGMAIVDVGLYTGYKALQRDLDDAVANSGGVIQRYEETDRSVVFYLSKITTAYTHISFNARRVFTVGRAQPVAVHVYDYYNPTVECVRFIHPQSGSNMLSTLCEGSTCECAAGRCAEDPFTKIGDFQGSKLRAKACEDAEHFAYEVKVVSFKRKGGFQLITMTILNPLKQGLDHVKENQNRTFWKSMNCGKPAIKKRRYLVIGSGGLPSRDDNGLPSYKYVVDERMSFYELPSASKIQNTKKWQRIANSVQQFMDDIERNGCSA